MTGDTGMELLSRPRGRATNL